MELKTIQNIKISQKHAVYSVTIVCFFLISWSAGFEFSKMKDYAIAYPVAVFYILSPFFLVWSVWKMFTYEEAESLTKAKGEQITKDVFYNHNGNVESNLIQALECEIESKALEHKKRMNDTDLNGRIFASVAIIIPTITWVYAIGSYSDKEKLQNLWALTFSSMTAGFLFLTIGVTMLRHSKAIQEGILDFDKKIFFLRKLRIVLISVPEKSENKEIYKAIYSCLLTNDEETKKDTPAENNDEPIMVKFYEALGKVQDKT